MKIIVVSDTHGRINEFINKLNNMEKPDLIIHLGDYVEDGEEIQNIIKVKTVIVKGNGDYFNQNYKEDMLLEVEGKKIFLTHGHRYNVRNRIDNLLYKCEELKADIALFGHTHIPIILEESGIMIMNPGSASYPRGNSIDKTFGIIEIDGEINMTIERINN